MALRLRRNTSDVESALEINEHPELVARNAELEIQLIALRQQLEAARHKEKKLLNLLKQSGNISSVDLDSFTTCDNPDNRAGFFSSLLDRAVWLIGLLIIQSCSSFILAFNERLLRNHTAIVYFLTMLVGAGGNAGNQATVRVIRELALGTLTTSSRKQFVLKEILTAACLGILLGLFGLVRVLLFQIDTAESLCIAAALVLIVFLSVVLGSLLPLCFDMVGLDPAHSSTSIQVIMDIAGVLITCFVAALALEADVSKRMLM